MFNETKRLIQEMMDNQIVPGVDYTLIEHDQENVSQTLGYSSIRPQIKPLKKNQFFDLASLTKVIGTVPVILILCQREKLNLDDTVNRYLPEIKDSRVKIRHLITHTSGVKAWIDNRDDLNAAQLRDAIYREITFGADFNQKIEYNDYNYLLLGFIVEKILHVPIQTAIQETVLKPLGLRHMTFTPDPFRAVPTEIRNGLLLRGMVHDPKAASLGLHAGSAGLFGTKHDVVKFTLAMMADSNAIFSENLLKDFTVNQTDNQNLIRSFGWAFVDQKKNPGLLRHSGYTGTLILFNRITKNGLVLLSNRVHPVPNATFLDYRQKIYQTFLREDF